MSDLAEEALHPEQREWLLDGLREMAEFRGVGRRLLADLIDRSRVHEREIAERDPSQRFTSTPEMVGRILALAVISDRVHVRSRIETEALHSLATLPRGVYGRDTSVLKGFRRLHVGPLQDVHETSIGKGSRYLAITLDDLVASPELAWRMPPPEEMGVDEIEGGPLADARRPELVWLAADPPWRTLLRPLQQILAAMIARPRNQGGAERNAAIAELGEHLRAAVWSQKEGRLVPKVPTFVKVDGKGVLEGIFDAHQQRQRGHLLVTNPDDAMRVPRAFDSIVFDRIIHLTDRIPENVPASLRPILREDVFSIEDQKRREAPYFVAYVPTILAPLGNPPPRRRRGFRARDLPVSFAVDGTVPKNDPSQRGMRANRDACVVPLDAGKLAAAWNLWSADDGAQRRPFLDAAVAAGAIAQESASRWVRGITMRKVGVAVSGGGASALRFAPVLWKLHQKAVPVDVFAGLSGGALLGAFYCRHGLRGLSMLADLGPFIQLTMPLAPLSTAPLEWVTDLLLGGACVENLEVRLAAATVALCANAPARARVVVGGTLGEAARVSGSLPFFFGPTDKRGDRYCDGSGCAIVPSRIARDYGADVVLACNAIPVPASTNPLSKLPFGSELRKAPILDRFIDLTAWYAFLQQEVNRRFGEEAEAFLEFGDAQTTPLEPVLFVSAWSIIADANRQSARIDAQVQRLADAWLALGT